MSTKQGINKLSCERIHDWCTISTMSYKFLVNVAWIIYKLITISCHWCEGTNMSAKWKKLSIEVINSWQ